MSNMTEDQKNKMVKLAYGDLCLQDLNNIPDIPKHNTIKNMIKLSLKELGFEKIEETKTASGKIYSHPELYEYRKNTTQENRNEFEQQVDELEGELFIEQNS